MRVLLLGANGTLGSALEEALSDENLTAWTMKNLDLGRLDSIRPKITAIKPDVVVNAAAYTAVDEAELHEREAQLINGDAVGELARACQSLRALLIHYSTDYVFDGSQASGYGEDAIPRPMNAYGRSKLQGERLIRTSGVAYILIRTSRLFGHHASADGTKKNFVVRILELASTKDELQVVDDERSNPTYAPDLAAATIELIRGRRQGVFHRTNDGSCSWYQFAREIVAQRGLSVSIEAIAASFFPRKAIRPQASILLSTKLRALRPWQDALRQYLATIPNHT